MFLKNKNIIFKIRRSKVTDYAALRINFAVLLSLVWSQVCIFFCNLLKLWAFFSVTNTTATNELSLPVMFSSV